MSRQAPTKGAVENILEHHWSHSKVQHGSATWSSLSYQLWPNGSWTLGTRTEGLYDLFSIYQSFTPLLETSNATWFDKDILKGNSGFQRRVRFVRNMIVRVLQESKTCNQDSQVSKLPGKPASQFSAFFQFHFHILGAQVNRCGICLKSKHDLLTSWIQPISANIPHPTDPPGSPLQTSWTKQVEAWTVRGDVWPFLIVSIFLCASFFSLFHLSSLCKL